MRENCDDAISWLITNRCRTTVSVTGSCLCGRVKIEVQRFDRGVVACHCAQCRKQSGHHFAATRAQLEDLSISGEGDIKWYKASEHAERGFCQNCGSVLFWKQKEVSHISILAGCLDSPTGLKLTRHIFTDDKGDYYKIADGADEFPQAD